MEILFKVVNVFYRLGYLIIEDEMYDEYFNYFKIYDLDNLYLLNVEFEVLIDSKIVWFLKKMFFIDKVYFFEEIKKWMERIIKVVLEIDFD